MVSPEIDSPDASGAATDGSLNTAVGGPLAHPFDDSVKRSATHPAATTVPPDEASHRKFGNEVGGVDGVNVATGTAAPSAPAARTRTDAAATDSVVKCLR